MAATVVGLVTPHLLRIVDLANDAEKAINVDFHVRESVARTMEELSLQYNAAALVAAYVEGLENATTVMWQETMAALRSIKDPGKHLATPIVGLHAAKRIDRRMILSEALQTSAGRTVTCARSGA